ncbi:protein decapping 5-like isoform X2 [Cornus florida]|uniref:protein decapping 5-like isoform X2 n=1 Tax=Cornus florida TaxID=4283 RepID=UPI0028A01D50|nr:protein decapping 5-like isoform X2 [Cornus florida]
MAAESSRSSSSADSYIGSLISLTSKSEIRYEGVLYSINTEESSIGLRDVRSFGTEGRKKDGPQVPPSDKVFEYILFRGSDIKDLQVKSSPPVQTTSAINSDPAIIQSHYPHPASTSSSLPYAVSGSLTDLNSQTSQLGHPVSTFQGGLPLYQPGGNLGSWGPSPPPPSANGSGLAMPMYWQGYYGPPNGLPHLHQQPLLRPPPGLSIPPPMQQPMQYPGFNASLPTGTSMLPGSNLPEYPSPLNPASTSSINFVSTSLPPLTLPSTLPPASSVKLALETLPNVMPNETPISALPTVTPSASLPSLSHLTTSSPGISAIVPPISNKSNAISNPSLLFQTMPQPMSSVVGTSSSSHTESPTPSLITPGQLLQSGPAAISPSQASQMAHKDVEVVQVSSSSSEPSAPVRTEAQPPILPLPQPSRASQKPNGPPFQTRHSYRGRERGRGTWSSRPVTKFTEDFDFIAMNEKFKKDEVWGHLGKSNRSHSKDKEGDGKGSDVDDSQDEEDAESSKVEMKPVYNKDDFFDSLSCNALDHESNNGRTRFSEQMKIDTETFGDFPRYRGGRGPGRGGRFRGPYYGRGYGYVGRGRGRGVSSHAS